MKLRALLIVCSLIAVPLAARAEEPADYAFAQAPGVVVPADAMFTESDGRRMRFGDLAGHRPIVLALGYFHCPMLCSIVRDDMLEALSHTGMKAGADYDLAVVSIDPAETVEDDVHGICSFAEVVCAEPSRHPLGQHLQATCCSGPASRRWGLSQLQPRLKGERRAWTSPRLKARREDP